MIVVMLADKDIDAALELIDAWHQGMQIRKRHCLATSDRYADRKTGLAMKRRTK
jgi:hypothetical protein